MPLDIPDSAKEVVARSKADVQRELQQSNPFLKNSWLGAIVTGAANRIYDFYLQLKEAIKQSFPDTATGNYLIRWGAIFGKQPLAATKSSGQAVASGVAGSIVPAGIVLTASGVGEFDVISGATISNNQIAVNELKRSGSTVTATVTSTAGLFDGMSVTVTGAASSDYNITAECVVVSGTAFQYEITGAPSDELNTSALASFVSALVDVQSKEFGADQNLDAGSPLKLQSPVVGVDDEFRVNFGAIGGGTDQETDAQFRNRVLDRIQNPVANFNVAAIKEKAKEVNGVTRVFVQEVTPEVGQVTTYFMRDNDVNPIPDASEVAAVRDKILEIKPANTDSVDVFVFAPSPVSVNFDFSSITPNTVTMQAAIKSNLEQFFIDTPSVGVDVDKDAYRSVIYSTVDTVTGDTVTNFVLNAPNNDISIGVGEIGVLGSVTF